MNGAPPPDPARLAELHASAFDAPWDAFAFAALLVQPGVFAVERPDGFVLTGRPHIEELHRAGEHLLHLVDPPGRTLAGQEAHA